MYVHGNIKSSNVLLNSRMEVGISDFGLLQLLANSPVASRIVGYQAPEVAQTGNLTPQSDVYSFGVVSFVCLMLQTIIRFLCNLPIPSQCSNFNWNCFFSGLLLLPHPSVVG